MNTGKKAVRKLGKRVRQFREERGWTQEVLAAQIGVEQAYISSIERGVYSPSIAKIALIAEALGITLSVLFETV